MRSIRDIPARLLGTVVAPLAVALCSSGCSERAPAATVHPPPAPSSPRPAAPPANLDGYRTAIDLVDNRVHATTHAGGRLVLDTGGVDFHKYIDGGWKTSWILGDRDGGKRVAFVSNISASLFVPLDAGAAAGGGDLLLGLTLRSLAPKQRLSVFVNEKPLPALDVDATWKSYDVPVPAGVIQPGENKLRLTFRAAGTTTSGKRSAAAVERITLGPPPPPGTAAATASVASAGAAALGGVSQRALSVAGGPSRISFYVQVPDAAKLALSVGSQSAGASALIRVATDGRPARTLHEAAATPGWSDAALDLAPEAGRAARIDFEARGGAVLWGTPRIVVKAPAPAAAPSTTKMDRIFVWMVDTFRADKMRAYNAKTRVETPSYDAFAADATRFEWAHVPGTWSLPSHASLLTGVYPTVHKAVAHESKLSRDVPFVAEDMKKAGYRTAIFSSNGYVSGKWGFERGWDEYRNFIRESLPNGADYLWKTAKSWILGNQQKAQFVYLATVDPHVIYNPKKEFLDRYWTAPYRGPIKPTLTGIQLGKIKAGALKVNDIDKAYLEALHDAEITQSDAAFATFIADLKAAGVYDTSAVIVVSDHGDEFWDHGDVGHAQSVYQELVRIPLLIRAPGRFPRGRVVKADVEVMDVYATMLDLAGITPAAAVQGASLVSLAADEVGQSPRAALSLNGGISRGMKVGRYRLIHAGAQKMELYDCYDDPREQTDVLTARPIALRQMRNVFSLLYGHEAKWNKARWGSAANLTAQFLEDVE